MTEASAEPVAGDEHDAQRQRIEQVKQELIKSGESPEDAERWLQRHLDELPGD